MTDMTRTVRRAASAARTAVGRTRAGRAGR